MDNSIFGKTQSDDFLFSGEEADNEFLENEAIDINDIAEKKSDRKEEPKEELIVNKDSKINEDEPLSAEDQLYKEKDESKDSIMFAENNDGIDFNENRRILDDIDNQDKSSQQKIVKDLPIENNKEKNNLDFLPEQDVLEENISDDNSLNENISDSDNIPEKDESKPEQDIQEQESKSEEDLPKQESKLEEKLPKQESKLEDKLPEQESKLEENLPEGKNALSEQNNNKTLDVNEKNKNIDTTGLNKESVKNKNLNKKVKEEIPNELFDENTENKLDFTSTESDSSDTSSATEIESSDKDNEVLDENIDDSKVESKDNIAEIELESENSNIHNLLAPSNEVKSENDYEEDEESENDYEDSDKDKTKNNYCPEKLDFDIAELESINDDFLSEIQAEKTKQDLAVKKKLGLDNIENDKENDVNFEPLKAEVVLGDIMGLNANNIEEFLKSKRKVNPDDENKKTEIEEKDKKEIEENKINDKIDVNDSVFNLKNFKLNEDLWEELNLSDEMKKKVETRVKLEIKSFLKNNFLSSLEKIMR